MPPGAADARRRAIVRLPARRMDYSRPSTARSGRAALATLIRLLGDFDLAEETLQEAFAVAARAVAARRSAAGSPCAWLVSTARHKGIDRLRRDKSFAEQAGGDRAPSCAAGAEPEMPSTTDEFPDDRLRLIFTCCHPALALEAPGRADPADPLRPRRPGDRPRLPGASRRPWRSAWCAPRRKIRAARIPYVVPARRAPGRAARRRAARHLPGLQRGLRRDRAATPWCAPISAARPSGWPGCSRAAAARGGGGGLLGLMLLHDSRRAARLDARGELLTLEEQDRARWDAAEIARGRRPGRGGAARGRAPGPTPCRPRSPPSTPRRRAPTDTDWRADRRALRAAAAPPPLAGRGAQPRRGGGDGRGPERGLALIDALTDRGELDGYHLLPAARADLLRRLGRRAEAAAAYGRRSPSPPAPPSAATSSAGGGRWRHHERRPDGAGGGQRGRGLRRAVRARALHRLAAPPDGRGRAAAGGPRARRGLRHGRAGPARGRARAAERTRHRAGPQRGHARGRAAARARALEWTPGEAEDLPFAGDRFDAVVSQFGLMFFSDREAALARRWPAC